MDRCVVLVDAGYLLGAAASLLAGEPSRARIQVDHAGLVQALRERAQADTGLPLLRVYWFDGAPDRLPQPEHRRLRVMPRVTVRLGALTRTDGRWAQKGVDAAMHAELTELARNRACSDIVLVTGDGDLLPGLMAAKEHGVAVHLWAVQAADGDYNQSEDLVAEADERTVLDRAWITRAIRLKEPTGACAPQPAPRPEIAAILSAPLPENPKAPQAPERPPGPSAARNGAGGGGPAPAPQGADDGGVGADGPAGTAGGDGADTAGPPSPGPAGDAGEHTAAEHTAAEHTAAEHLAGGPVTGGPVADHHPDRPAVPTPKDLAGLARPTAGAPAGATGGEPPGSALRWSSDRGWTDRGGAPAESPEAQAMPTLAQLTTAEQRWADREEDITAVSGDPFEVGQVFARRWTDRLSAPVHLQRLSAEYPRIPHRIDGELLRYAARFGLLAHKDDQIDEHDRYAIRAGFWREVEARAPAAPSAP